MPYIGKKPENIIATAIDTTTGDFSGNVTAGGTLGVTGIGTFTDDIIIGDGKTIGSASKTDAITIASSGLVQLTSTGIGAGSQVLQVIDDGATLFQIRSEDGNISFPQSGAGIYLGVTSGNAANLLDDYEEGTWTPAVTFGGGATGVGYTTNTNGRYIKVGDSVTVTGCLFLNSKGSSTGDAVITGLPFAHRNSSEGTKASGSIGQTNISFTAFPSILGGGSSLFLFDTTTGGTLGAIDNSNFSDSSSVYFSASYATA